MEREGKSVVRWLWRGSPCQIVAPVGPRCGGNDRPAHRSGILAVGGKFGEEPDQVAKRGYGDGGDDSGGDHAALPARLSVTPFAFASFLIPSIRQFGIARSCFQLETVDGGKPSSRATADVPPSNSMISDGVCITQNYDNRKRSARG